MNKKRNILMIGLTLAMIGLILVFKGYIQNQQRMTELEVDLAFVDATYWEKRGLDFTFAYPSPYNVFATHDNRIIEITTYSEPFWSSRYDPLDKGEQVRILVKPSYDENQSPTPLAIVTKEFTNHTPLQWIELPHRNPIRPNIAIGIGRSEGSSIIIGSVELTNSEEKSYAVTLTAIGTASQEKEVRAIVERILLSMYSRSAPPVRLY